MKIVFISDTHNRHQDIEIPDGDLIIHAGDFSGRGHEYEVLSFFSWFSALPHKYKVFIAGNHDFMAERDPISFQKLIPDNLVYLNDSMVTIEGIRIWGSPITPWFHDWAFNRKRGAQIMWHWNLIPENIDILVTHGPPQGILDKTARGNEAGCEDLLVTLDRARPRIHVFGHIHEAYGQVQQDETLFINASILNLQYKIANQPVVIDWEEINFEP